MQRSDEKRGMEQRTIRVARTARYCVEGDPAGEVWLLLHGYGETAAPFLDRCRPLAEAGPTLLIAAEGLSRFYLRGGRGEVGASWMTRDLRQEEIAEYLAMIERVLEDAGVAADRPINLLGFSQGGATAMRVALQGRRPVDRLVMWGSLFDEEELRGSASRIARIGRLVLVGGEADRIVRPEATLSFATVVRSLGGVVVHHSHAGGHELDPPLLRSLGSR